jgi:hypothetical protein
MHLPKFRSVVVVALMFMATVATAVPVDPNDLWSWIVRCFIAMSGGHVDW